MGYLIYFNVVRSKDIINSAYNTRQDTFADRVVRGSILDEDGNELARTNVAEDGTETREYPYGNMYAHVVGYASNGKSGLESEENFNLLTSSAFILERIKNELQDKKNPGDNVVTTLSTRLQEAAYNALGDNKGAVVVMEPSTGKILAMVSKSDFNPNSVAENWDSLINSDDSVLLNRATQGLYAPGSTFKVVTSLEYIRENANYADYSYNCTGSIEHQGTTINCSNQSVHGQVNLEESLAYSCNASFSNIGLQLDISKFQDTTKDLLFDTKLPSVLLYNQSSFSLSSSDADAEVMMTAMGQGKLQVSPYHMALITAAIANGGTLMKPYLVDSITNYSGTQVDKNMPESYKELMTSAEAAQLTQYMQAVTEYGTASSLSGRGYTVAGKTGTAEYSSDKSKHHSWFIGFTNVDNPDLVISVVIENADQTGTSATYVAGEVFDAYYN
ncbi:MAG: peptidoglycan D,D-transpeptidase FtsI family protein [Lachnospiraceae bacterium]